MNEAIRMNECMDNGMDDRNMLMVHLEFECGDEERPRLCVKIPVTFEAAIVALALSACNNHEKNEDMDCS